MCAICHFGVSVGADESRARAAHTLYPVLPKRLPFCGNIPFGIMPRQPHDGKWWHIERLGEMKPQRRIVGAIRHDQAPAPRGDKSMGASQPWKYETERQTRSHSPFIKSAAAKSGHNQPDAPWQRR